MESPQEDTINIVVSESNSSSPGLKPTGNKDVESPHNKSDDASIISEHTAELDRLMELDGKPISKFKSETEELIRLFRSLTVLTPLQIRIIELRYLSLLRAYSNRMIYIDFFHHFTRSFVSLGSVIVPALLSIQSPTNTNSAGLYWTTWAISLLVTTLHNFVTIFRFEKKYFGLHATYEKLVTEGWSYLQLSGRYNGRPITSMSPPSHIIPTHKNQYSLFVHTIEKLQMRQIANEYNGQNNEKPQPNPALEAITTGDLSTPDSITSPQVVKKITHS